MSEIKQLLPSEYTRGLELHQVLCGTVRKINVSKALDYMKTRQIYQEEELDHIKRINKDPKGDDLKLVLCSASKQDKIDLKELEQHFIFDIHTVEVSKYPPYTKEQYEIFKGPWPITMKSKANDILNFNVKETKLIKENMRKAIDLAKESYLKGNRFNACVLVDPKTNKVLVEAIDETCREINSIRHCIMRMTDEFGKFCVESNKGIKKTKKSRNESDFSVEPVQEEVKAETKDKEEIKTGDSVNDKRKASEDIKTYFHEGYYYCTNLDLYLVMEPCVMCAMALVHSRIGKVFYSLPYSDFGTGGLNENLQLNCLNGLNHKYKVFYDVEAEYAKDQKEGLSS